LLPEDEAWSPADRKSVRRPAPALLVETPSLPGAHRSVAVPQGGAWWRRLFAFFGPGYLVAVGYMDPGNWATDLAGGSAFGYTLLSVVLLSSLMAVLLQVLTVRLGIATGRDLAQACRESYSRPVATALWILCELAICACDLAEVIGTAIALNLLFSIPLEIGVVLTVLDVLLLLALQHHGFRYLEAFVIALIVLIFACFAATLWLAKPDWAAVARGLVPDRAIVTNREHLYLAVGIIGATVMPHNLYLHSATVQTRRFVLDAPGQRSAIRFATADVAIALVFAFMINAAILIVSASVFHANGHRGVAELQEAYHLLTPLLGTGLAAILFGLALLASGQSSTLTATLAGQIVMEGFMTWRIRPWIRRLATRLIALVPATVAILLYGNEGLAKLLVLSQVVLSLQLPFAMVPLIRFTAERRRMGEFASPRWLRVASWIIAVVIIGLNGALLVLAF
jgi:manganese transport protein